MDYEIKLSGSGRYVVVKIFNEMNVDKGHKTAIESQKLADEYNLKKFLYDVREAPNVEPPSSNYFFAYKDMPTLKGIRGNMVAILISPEDNSHNFLSTVMYNAGYNVQLFTDLSEAVLWLEEKSPIQ